jgi:predicted amidohydrolase
LVTERDKIRVAVAQTLTVLDEPAQNVERALRYMALAHAQGADIVCFPETYPGPWTPPLDYEALPRLAQAAQELDLYVVAGLIEAVPEHENRYYVSQVLLDDQGGLVGRYRRTTPRGPWLYQGGDYWDFHWKEAEALPVFETPWCKVGLAICSEVYMPELCRGLALQGAELIFMPAGVPKVDLWHTWRTLIFARAIENLCFTATCQNVFAPTDLGLAMICSPEEVMVESTREGVLVIDCDLGRIRWLRGQEDTWGGAGTKRCKPGIFEHWYRPEFHGDRIARLSRSVRGPQGTHPTQHIVEEEG